MQSVNEKLAKALEQLEEEKKQRLALEERLTKALESFETQLSTLKVVFKAKLHELETQIETEREQKQQLIAWIKSHLGQNLEHVKELIKDEVASAKLQPKQTSSATVVPTDPIAAAAASKVRRKLSAGAAATPTINSATSSETVVESASPASSRGSTQETSRSTKSVSFNPSVSSKQQAQIVASSPHGSMNDMSSLTLKEEESRSDEPQVRPRKVTRNKKLMTLEEQCFGTEDVEISKLPQNDASFKTKPTRAVHFLTTQNLANLSYKCPTLLDLSQEYVSRGGRLVFVPLHKDDLVKDTFSFGIKTFDQLYPICPDGFHRSQVLYLVLKGIKRLLGNPDGVALPHGARSGYDPFVLRDTPNDPMQQYTFMSRLNDQDNVLARAFFEAFGQERVPRVGEDESKKSSADLAILPGKLYTEAQRAEVQKNKARMREYFDLYYYAQKPKEKTEKGRTIFFVFGSAVPIVLQRLMETNMRQDLSRVLVVALPFGVEPFTTAKAADLVATYRFYASLFKPYTE